MRDELARVGLALVLVLTGCDQLFGLVPVTGQSGSGDAAGGDGASTSVALVQHVTGGFHAATTLSVTLPALPAAGDALVMVGAAETAPLATTTGGGVTTWRVAARSDHNQNVEIWYGITDGSSSTVTTTCMTPCLTTQGPMWMSLSEWSGLATASLFETGNASTGTASAASPGMANAGAITTIDAPDLLIFAVSDRGTISTQVTEGPWTALDTITDPVAQSAWYRVVSVAGPQLPQTTVTSSWDAAIAAFRAVP